MLVLAMQFSRSWLRSQTQEDHGEVLSRCAGGSEKRTAKGPRRGPGAVPSKRNSDDRRATARVTDPRETHRGASAVTNRIASDRRGSLRRSSANADSADSGTP